MFHGIAICSPSDQFVKKVGYAKALGRARQYTQEMTGNWVSVTSDDATSKVVAMLRVEINYARAKAEANWKERHEAD